jgi:hypothetical protein
MIKTSWVESLFAPIAGLFLVHFGGGGTLEYYLFHHWEDRGLVDAVLCGSAHFYHYI